MVCTPFERNNVKVASFLQKMSIVQEGQKYDRQVEHYCEDILVPWTVTLQERQKYDWCELQKNCLLDYLLVYYKLFQ
jgi:hypothetical protein